MKDLVPSNLSFLTSLLSLNKEKLPTQMDCFAFLFYFWIYNRISFSVTDLSRMYKLLKPIPTGLSVMLKEFEEYIADTGLASVKALYTENVSFFLSDNFLKLFIHLLTVFMNLV